MPCWLYNLQRLKGILPKKMLRRCHWKGIYTSLFDISYRIRPAQPPNNIKSGALYRQVLLSSALASTGNRFINEPPPYITRRTRDRTTAQLEKKKKKSLILFIIFFFFFLWRCWLSFTTPCNLAIIRQQSFISHLYSPDTTTAAAAAALLCRSILCPALQAMMNDLSFFPRSNKWEPKALVWKLSWGIRDLAHCSCHIIVL